MGEKWLYNTGHGAVYFVEFRIDLYFVVLRPFYWRHCFVDPGGIL